MWLLHSNRILTKDILIRKKWTGDPHCVLCSYALENEDHLFLNCPKIQEILFWLGKTQQHMFHWDTCTDIVQFSLSLVKTDREGFLLVYSAICWTIWKYRNDIIFRHSTPKSARNIILLIISLVEY